MSKEHILLGLEPDNLLGFLALLGFHRAVNHAAPEWTARVCWGGVPLRPHMVLSGNIEQSALLAVAAQGCDALAAVHEFDREDVRYTPEEARRELSAACAAAPRVGRLRVDLLTALMSDIAVKDNGEVRATPFCAMFGQGHQHFLGRLNTVPQGVPNGSPMTQSELNSPAMLEQALFRTWERKDRTQSFRWDPLEDRRYALRFEDPSSEKGLTVHGANRLASLALPLLPAVPTWERGEVRLYAVGTNWEAGSGVCVRWPIWSRPATLGSVLMMLAGCGTHEALPGLRLIDIYRSERISVGKFFSFTRALPTRQAP
jgi:hypothetical protein